MSKVKSDLPQLFIASSTESLHIASAIKYTLMEYKWAKAKVWDKGVFFLSEYTLKDLLDELKLADYGIIILADDDKTESRGLVKPSTRDNVIFESGILVGKIGYQKVFFVRPSKVDIRIPSDLYGLNFGSYDIDESDVSESVGLFCHKVKQTIDRHKKRSNPQELQLEPRIEKRRSIVEVYILDEDGDCTIKEKVELTANNIYFYEKEIEIWSDDKAMNWTDLRLEVYDQNGKSLTPDPILDRPVRKRFKISIMLFNKDVQDFSYRYSCFWNRMFPQRTEYYSTVLSADENTFVLTYPNSWTMKYIKLWDALSGEIIKCKPYVSSENEEYKSITIDIDNFYKNRSINISWER
jgi:predicted nucleotide-binding protein